MQKWRPVKRNLLLTAVLSISAIALTACSGSVYGYESDITSVNETSWHLWRGAWLAAGVVGIFTAILILWPVFRHRRKEGDPEYPKQTQYNIPVEIAYTVIPFIIVRCSSTSRRAMNQQSRQKNQAR